MMIKKFNESYNKKQYKYVRIILEYNEEKTAAAQEFAFEYGYTWNANSTELKYLKNTYELDFNTYNKRITFCDSPLSSYDIESAFGDNYIILKTFFELKSYFKHDGLVADFEMCYKNPDKNISVYESIENLDIFLKTDGVVNPFNLLYNKKNKNIYENKNSIDLFVFEAKSDNDVVKAQEYAFQNGYTWYGGGISINYNKISQCKHFFYEINNKKLTISSDLEDKSYDEFIKEYYDTENFIVIDDIKILESNLKSNGNTFKNYFNKKMIYENIENNSIDYVLFIPEDESDCTEIQEYAFSCGWKWYSGTSSVRHRGAKKLFFSVKYKNMLYSDNGETAEETISTYKKEFDEVVRNIINKNILKEYLKNNILLSDFNLIYNKTNKTNNIYESIKPGINYIDFLLPTDMKDKIKCIQLLEKHGWEHQQLRSTNNEAIVQNLEDANILHIFTGAFNNTFLFIKHERGIDSFSNIYLSLHLDVLLKIYNIVDFYELFDEKYFDISTYFKSRKNIYD